MTGRLTLPTDADIIDETIRLKNLLGADALRDCDGTEMPEALLSEPVKKYATYYTTRKDNAWAMKHPEEIQQEYLISNRITARGETLRIRLMEGFHTEQLKVNTLDDPKRWWEVIDRTTGEVVPTDAWEFDQCIGNDWLFQQCHPHSQLHPEFQSYSFQKYIWFDHGSSGCLPYDSNYMSVRSEPYDIFLPVSLLPFPFLIWSKYHLLFFPLVSF